MNPRARDRRGQACSNARLVVQMVTVPESLAFLRGQAAVLRANAFDVVCVSSPGPRLETFGEEEGVSVVPVSMQRRIRPLHDVRALVVLVVQFWKLRPELVHAHTPKAALLGMIAGWMTRVPVRIFHVHGLPVETAHGLRRSVLLFTDRLSARLAHRVIFVSASLMSRAIELGMCPPAKARVLAHGSANGVDAEGRFNPDSVRGERLTGRRQHGWSDADLVVGYVGRLVRDKGVLDLLTAWRDLRGPGRFLLVVGPEEQDDALPVAAIDEMRDSLDITWVPWTDRPEDLLGLMDVLVLPSYREGLPLSLLEASAMGLPIVATDIPGIRDAVEHGIAGTLVPVRRPEALRAGIEHYLADPQLRRRHGIAGRTRALEHFRPSAIHQALVDEYVELTKPSASREAIRHG